MFASFEDLISPATIGQALQLLEGEQPNRFAAAKDVERSAITYALQRTGLNRRVFRGNEVGVHIGMLGADTRDHLSLGTPRRHRPRLDWHDIVRVWTGKFLPPSDGALETANAHTRNDHNDARRRRRAAAHRFPQDQVWLSYDLDTTDSYTRLTVSDLAP